MKLECSLIRRGAVLMILLVNANCGFIFSMQIVTYSIINAVSFTELVQHTAYIEGFVVQSPLGGFIVHLRAEAYM